MDQLLRLGLEKGTLPLLLHRAQKDSTGTAVHLLEDLRQD